MNLLAFIWLVGCIAAVCIAFAVPSEVWSAVADRIRNPRPSASERILQHYYDEDAVRRPAVTEGQEDRDG